MGGVTIALLAVLATLLVGLYRYFSNCYSYWRKLDVPGPKPSFVLGNFGILKPFQKAYYDIYYSFPDLPYVGIYEFLNPVMLIRSTDMIEKVLVKDFSHFQDRGNGIDENVSPIDNGLFTLKGAKWRTVRNKLLPTFTTGKIRMMYSQMEKCSGSILTQVDEAPMKVDSRDLLSYFTNMVAANCVFGLDLGDQEKAKTFVKMSRKTFEFGFFRIFMFLILNNFPRLGRYLRVSFTPPDIAAFFTNVISQTLAHREKTGEKRNDFVQLLLQLKQKGFVEMAQTVDPDDDYLEIGKSSGPTEVVEFTDGLLTAQAFIFLSAGSEPAANTTVLTLVELSKRPDIQKKARAEIVDVLKKHGGEFTYDAIKEMVYVEQCIKETMRFFPIVQQIIRMCTMRYEIKEGLYIEPGQSVVIPLKALQMDPKYFPDPDVYHPDRFGPDEVVDKFVYMPFGTGPRMCIGLRFAMVEMKLMLAKLLYHFEVSVNPETHLPIKMMRYNFFTTPDQKVFLDFKKVNEFTA